MKLKKKYSKQNIYSNKVYCFNNFIRLWLKNSLNCIKKNGFMVKSLWGFPQTNSNPTSDF